MNEYYKNCPFPKPTNKKKKKAVNGYKDKPNRYCYYCGTPHAERHEVFFGSGLRQISINLGFQVDLCSNCHRDVHEENERGQQISQEWREHYQKEYMNKLQENGMSEEESLKVWMTLIGRNYI